jgi:hypothetical protein
LRLRKEIEMKKIGLDELDVIAVFRRTYADRVVDNPLIDSIAKSVGEVIEENNRRLLEEILVASNKKGGE